MTMLLKIFYRFSVKNVANVVQKDILNDELKLLNRYLFICCECRQPKRTFHGCPSLFASKKKQEIKEKLREREYVTPSKRKVVIDVWEGMTVEELGRAMGKNADYVFELMYYVKDTSGYKYPDDILAWKTLVGLVHKANLRFKLISKDSPESSKDRDVYPEPPAEEDKLRRRPAVVTIMGHVDHGKTTLLDYLRNSSIVASEFGGITQHIGAFSVQVKDDSITFLDTPGHAAFKAMRSRGAHCTDIVVLVVAADDGVMEQTEESIRMAKDANVPIIVAINKIDKKDADVELTKKMIMVQGLVLEEFGGDIQCVPISALKGTNIDSLIEAIITQAELSNLRADPSGKVQGIVLETRQSPRLGKLTTALVQRGTLRKNCILTAGLAWARVRQMLNERGNVMKEAPPSTPVEVVGWQGLPDPGDIILEVESESRAREVIHCREKKIAQEKDQKDLEMIQIKRKEFVQDYKEKLKEARKAGYRRVKRGPKSKEIQETYTGPILNVIIRTDVEGSLEAIIDCLSTYYDPLCKLDIVHSEVGNVTIGDVELAEAFNAVIYNFNVGVLPEAAEAANTKIISIRPHNVIYRLLEDVKAELNSRLPPVDREEITAEAVVQELFMVSEGNKKVPVAGCRCVTGDLKKNANYKVLRDGVEIHRGQLVSMRNMKTEVTSIKTDQECGLRFQDTSVIFKPGDIIQSYKPYTVAQEIKWDPY